MDGVIFERLNILKLYTFSKSIMEYSCIYIYLYLEICQKKEHDQILVNTYGIIEMYSLYKRVELQNICKKIRYVQSDSPLRSVDSSNCNENNGELLQYLFINMFGPVFYGFTNGIVRYRNF